MRWFYVVNFPGLFNSFALFPQIFAHIFVLEPSSGDGGGPFQYFALKNYVQPNKEIVYSYSDTEGIAG